MSGKHMAVSQCCFEDLSADWRDHQFTYRNKAHYKNLSTAVILLICNTAQNKEVNDVDIVLVLDCVEENISAVECSDSDDKIGDKYLIAEVAYK
jgi:hypothetical protein